MVKNKAADAKKHLQMIGVQLLKESDEANRTKKRGKRASRMTLEVSMCDLTSNMFMSLSLIG